MLTIFSIPKAFEGHMDVIQRNAIQSWKRLDPNCQVILIGDDPGTAEVAEELGVSNIPQVARNEFGTPLLDSAYQLAEDAATNSYLCYVNADIILTSSLIDAFKKVREQTDRFFMTARRWDYSQDTLLEYDQDWETRLLGHVSVNGKLAHFSAIDFWVYPRGLLEGIPPLAVGRIAFESWCLYKARQMKADVIDSTDVVMSIHQDHDYSHHPEGELGIGTGIEAQRNRAMVGGAPYFFCIRDRTHKLTHNGLKRTLDGWKLWRSFRTSNVLYPKMPLPLKLSCMMLNGFFDNLRKVLRSIRMLTPLGRRIKVRDKVSATSGTPSVDPKIARRFDEKFGVYRSSKIARLQHGHVKLLFSKLLEAYTRKTGNRVKQKVSLVWGQRINIVYPDTVSIELARYGCYEEGLTKMVLEHVKPGSTFLDIGAQIGYYTLLASWLVGEYGQVHSFEPTPSTFELLRSNTIENDNVHLNQKALSSSAGKIAFNDYGIEYMGSNSRYHPRMDEKSFNKLRPTTIQVTALTLDDYVEGKAITPSFVKIDAESSEYEILRGMTRILEDARPIISVEVGDMDIEGVPSSGELINYLISKGYQPYEFSDGRFSVHQVKDRYSYDNILFMPER